VIQIAVRLLFYVAVFVCFAAIGYIIWRGYKQRKVFFENQLSFCNHLLVEISFSKNTVLHVIENYAQAYSLPFRQMLFNYKSLIDGKKDITRESINSFMWRRLKPHERAIVADFLYELGRHGPQQEREKIENKKIQFDTFHQNAATALKKEASIYLKVFILLGVGAVVLLL